jgi:hypothetical protein
MLTKFTAIEPDRKMKIKIKDLNTTSLEVTEKGIELEFRELNGKHVGDLLITPTRLIWNKGRTSKYGKSKNWPELFKSMK